MNRLLRVLRFPGLLLGIFVPVGGLFAADGNLKVTRVTTPAGTALAAQDLGSAPVVVFHATIGSTPVTVTTGTDQVKVEFGDRIPALNFGGGHIALSKAARDLTVTLGAGRIRISTEAGGAAPGASVMGDAVRAETVNYALSVAALTAVAGAITAGLTPAEAAQTQARALARGAVAASPGTAQAFAKLIARESARAATTIANDIGKTEEIFAAVVRGTMAGVLQSLPKPAPGSPPTPIPENLLTAAAVGAMQSLAPPGSPPPVWFGPVLEQALTAAFADAGSSTGLSITGVDFARVAQLAGGEVLAGMPDTGIARATSTDPGAQTNVVPPVDPVQSTSTPRTPVDAFPISQSGG